MGDDFNWNEIGANTMDIKVSYPLAYRYTHNGVPGYVFESPEGEVFNIGNDGNPVTGFFLAGPVDVQVLAYRVRSAERERNSGKFRTHTQAMIRPIVRAADGSIKDIGNTYVLPAWSSVGGMFIESLKKVMNVRTPNGFRPPCWAISAKLVAPVTTVDSQDGKRSANTIVPGIDWGKADPGYAKEVRSFTPDSVVNDAREWATDAVWRNAGNRAKDASQYV